MSDRLWSHEHQRFYRNKLVEGQWVFDGYEDPVSQQQPSSHGRHDSHLSQPNLEYSATATTHQSSQFINENQFQYASRNEPHPGYPVWPSRDEATGVHAEAAEVTRTRHQIPVAPPPAPPSQSNAFPSRAQPDTHQYPSRTQQHSHNLSPALNYYAHNTSAAGNQYHPSNTFHPNHAPYTPYQNAALDQGSQWQQQALSPAVFTPAYTMAQQVPNKGKGLTIGGTYSSTNPTPTSHYETLDPKFYVRPRSFFKEGKVFAVLFTEAAGTTATGYNPCISVVSYGQSVHTQIRRFIVVRAKREFCFACPIFTYNNQGTLKPGVRAKEHAIAYTVGREPTLLPGEATLEKSPIPIVNVAGEPAFHIASRIYFGIHHPIQYNVKVKELGDVPPDWVPTLRQYWTSENDQATGQDIDVTASATYDAETPLPPT